MNIKYNDAELNQLCSLAKQLRTDAERTMWSGRLGSNAEFHLEIEERYYSICSGLQRLSSDVNRELSVRMEARRVWKELYDQHGLGLSPYGG